MSEKLKLQTNVAADIALKFDEGKEMSGEYGDSVMYTLTDDRVWFAPPIVAQKISALGIVKGEPFRVVKAEIVKGNRRSIEYQVSRLEVETEPAARTAANVNAPQLVPAHQQQNNVQLPSSVAGLLQAMRYAVDVAQLTEAHAAERGYSVRFTSEDIRTMGNTLYIQVNKGGQSWAA